MIPSVAELRSAESFIVVRWGSFTQETANRLFNRPGREEVAPTLAAFAGDRLGWRHKGLRGALGDLGDCADADNSLGSENPGNINRNRIAEAAIDQVTGAETDRRENPREGQACAKGFE